MSDANSSQFSFCPYCGNRLEEISERCFTCGRSLEKFTSESSLEGRIASLESEQKALQSRNPGVSGVEYRSRLTLFGWPLLHVATGNDPISGKLRVAKGLIAIGNTAIGGIAVGGLAIGGITIGGMSIGMIGMGGFCIGLLLALGGAAIGFGLSLGGLAVGTIAIGGAAIGYYSIGGMALGNMAFGGNARNQNALTFFKNWHIHTTWLFGMLRPVVVSFVVGTMVLLPFIRKSDKLDSSLDGKSDDAKHPQSGSAIGMFILILLGAVFGIATIWLALLVLHLFS